MQVFLSICDLLLAGPGVTIGESVVSPLGPLLGLNHSVLLKLNQTALWVPRPCAVERNDVHVKMRVYHFSTYLFVVAHHDIGQTPGKH